jgi:Tol biopolymer transport system component
MNEATFHEYVHRVVCCRQAQPTPRVRAVASATLLAVVTVVLVASGCGQGAAVDENTVPPRRNGDILFSNGRLYLVRPDGTHIRPIPGSPRDVTSASVSPDGTRIAFARELGGSCPARMYLMQADGTRVRPFTGRVNDPVMEAPCFGGLAWSPDGTHLAFTKDDFLGSSIWGRDIDGGSPRELSEVPPESGGRDDFNPAWSPDGKTIAFDRTDPPGLWLMDADGGNQRRLDTTSRACPRAYEPDWSPDGEWIVFARTCKRSIEGKRKSRSEIWLVRPDGSDLRRLTDAGVWRGDNSSPAWSPDGTRIVFESLYAPSPDAAPDDRIYVISADGTGQKRLTRFRNYTIDPDWLAQP